MCWYGLEGFFGFDRVLAGFWKGFGRVLEGFWQGFDRVLAGF